MRPALVLEAMRDHGVDVQTLAGWDKGREPAWKGALVHHTATASASESNPAPTLYWLTHAYDKPAAHMLVGKTPGHTYLCGVDSYHCGQGGPWPHVGIPAGNRPDMLFGIEIDDPGVNLTITDYQIDNTARILAALVDLFGWQLDAIGTHKCWTDLCHLPPGAVSGPGAHTGRKNDTIDGAWREWPGNPNPVPYNAPWWRERTADRLATPDTWDGTIPSRSAAQRAADDPQGEKNKAAWRLACRLHDLGHKPNPPKPAGRQTYPFQGVQAARESWGWNPGEGNPSKKVWVRLFGKDKP